MFDQPPSFEDLLRHVHSVNRLEGEKWKAPVVELPCKLSVPLPVTIVYGNVDLCYLGGGHGANGAAVKLVDYVASTSPTKYPIQARWCVFQQLGDTRPSR